MTIWNNEQSEKMPQQRKCPNHWNNIMSPKITGTKAINSLNLRYDYGTDHCNACSDNIQFQVFLFGKKYKLIQTPTNSANLCFALSKNIK